MKKIAFTISMAFVALMLMVASPVMAQTDEELTQAAEEEAQALMDDGYKPTGLPIKIQLKNYYKKMMETTVTGEQKYIEAHGIVTANTQPAAQAAALKTARESLVQSIRTQVATKTETNLANSQYSAEDAATVDEFFQKGGSFSTEELTDYITVKNIYKRLPNGSFEVQITILYDRKKLQDKVRQKAISDMKNKLNRM